MCSGVVRRYDRTEDFSCSKARTRKSGLNKAPLCLCSEFLPHGLAEVRVITTFTSGRIKSLTRVMSDEEGWPWVGESRFAAANSELLTYYYYCRVISCSGEPGGVVDVKVAEHHLVSTVLQEVVKIGGVVPGAGGRGG